MKHIMWDCWEGKNNYFDKNGNEIKVGDFVKFPDGKVKEIYETEDNELGTDATNPLWIEIGRAVACEYGIYPLEENDCEVIEKI